MLRINTYMNKFFNTLASIFVLSCITLYLASCGGSSNTTTTAKPGSWDKVADFSGSKRSGAASFVINGKAYVVGGFDALNTRVVDVYQYDPVKDTWAEQTKFPGIERSGAIGFVIGSKGYVGTGLAANNVYLKDFWEFDPAGNGGLGSWKQILDLPGTKGRNGAVAFSVANRGYVGAGFNGSNELNDVYEYVPGSNTWVVRAGLSGKRVNGAAFTIDNFAYVVFGTNNQQPTRTVEQYDPVNDVWTQKQQLTKKDKNGNTIAQPDPRDFASTFTIGSLGFISSGSFNLTPLSDTWGYDPATDTWTQYYSYTSPTVIRGSARDAAVGFGIGNVGYITTGRSGGVRFDDTWKFDPAGANNN